jgi:hypothetical protein
MVRLAEPALARQVAFTVFVHVARATLRTSSGANASAIDPTLPFIDDRVVAVLGLTLGSNAAAVAPATRTGTRIERDVVADSAIAVARRALIAVSAKVVLVSGRALEIVASVEPGRQRNNPADPGKERV